MTVEQDRPIASGARYDAGALNAAGGGVLAAVNPLRIAREVVRDLRGLHYYRYAMANFVIAQLKVRYQRSTLGFLWTLLNPILTMTVLALVFSQILGTRLDDYVLYLFSGMIPWQFFSACVESGSRSLIAKEHLIRKVRVQKLIFPLSDVLVAAVNMCFAMTALFIILECLGAAGLVKVALHAQLVLLPAGMLFLMLFSFGAALVAMTLVTRFRDFEHVIGVLLQAFYFTCPILYTPKLLGDYAFLLRFNPMAHLLAFFQDALYHGRWTQPEHWVAAPASALGMLVIGYVVYKRHEHDYIFLL
ncbi:MAG: ABC transporter permease [Phycisphaerae bacterium]